LAVHIIVFFGFILGCANESEQEGVVARVNDHPIYLDELETEHDARYFRWSRELPEDLEEIKSSYGKILLDKIVQNLIKQEMHERGLHVSEEEVQKKEQRIREDYPDGAFEKVLIEESINIDTWRKNLEQGLIWEKFTQEILKPKIKLDGEEIAEYYRAHMEDFFIPARIVFVHFASQDEKLIQEALDFFSEKKSVSEAKERFPEVTIGRYEMRQDQLPHDLAGDLKVLSSGEYSRIKEANQDIKYSVYVLDRKESTLLKPHQVYDIIRSRLEEDKMREAFHSWLEEAVASARIEINPTLSETMDFNDQ